ncbi:MAG: hypothetical protein NTW67_00315 [Candidatus Woesearchaeota archaeon]|nr:hypothetical protein [Candidatus Woesearchaeota archaeon]
MVKRGIAEQSSSGLFSPSGKKGFELQFHWIFVIIAGALILAFFFSVANKQRNLSQEKLQLTLATDIENIFTGAIVSRGTAQKLPVPPQGIAFECTEGCECKFKIANAGKDFGDKSMFAPALLQGQDIVVWSLELKLPYRVTKTQQQMTSTKYEEYQHTKFILLDVEPTTLDYSFKKESASAVKITPTAVQFYTQDGQELVQGGFLSYAGLPSLYAAIFSEDETMYKCGLKTAFRKLSYVSKLYAERAAELENESVNAGKTWCTYGAPTTGDVCQSTASIIGLLCKQHENAKQLADKLDDTLITELSTTKEQLDSANRNFLQQSCPEIF